MSKQVSIVDIKKTLETSQDVVREFRIQRHNAEATLRQAMRDAETFEAVSVAISNLPKDATYHEVQDAAYRAMTSTKNTQANRAHADLESIREQEEDALYRHNQLVERYLSMVATPAIEKTPVEVATKPVYATGYHPPANGEHKTA